MLVFPSPGDTVASRELLDTFLPEDLCYTKLDLSYKTKAKNEVFTLVAKMVLIISDNKVSLL